MSLAGRGSVLVAAAFAALVAVSPRQSVLAQGTAQQQPAAAAKPFAVEYYYKVKWGHFDEFMELYTKNHYPILPLYPNQEQFKKEEQRRFELLIEHTDVPVVLDDLKKWR